MSVFNETTAHKCTNDKTALDKAHEVGGLPPEAHTIKDNVADLAKNIKETTAVKAHAASDYVLGHMGDLRSAGEYTLTKTMEHVKQKPGKSIAIAFAAGMLASYLFGKRSS